jgi:hypothetical protein
MGGFAVEFCRAAKLAVGFWRFDGLSWRGGNAKYG